MSKSIKFVNNPYVVGGSMREDVFQSQLSVYVSLSINLLDNDGISNYSRTEKHLAGTASTISSALHLINQFLERIDDEDEACSIVGDYLCPIEDEFESCSALNVQIFDRENRLVIGGTVRYGSTIKWMIPVTNSLERTELQSAISALTSEASFESGWDNYSTARSLRAEAESLNWKLSASSPIIWSSFFKQELIDIGIDAKRC